MQVESSFTIMALLREQYREELILRFEPVNCLPRSCDFTPHDFLFWGYVKSKVFMDKPVTAEKLESNITLVIRKIPIEILAHIFKNWNVKTDRVSHSYKIHLQEL